MYESDDEFTIMKARTARTTNENDDSMSRYSTHIGICNV